MEKIYDVTALGEMLIDFAVNGESEQGNQLFEACNVEQTWKKNRIHWKSWG